MAWGSIQNDTQQTAINDTTEEFGATISLNAGETAAGYVVVNNESGSVTNGVRISVYVSMDAGTTWSDQPIIRFVYTPATVNDEEVPLSVTGWPDFRVGYLATAAPDDYTCQFKYKKDGVSL